MKVTLHSSNLLCKHGFNDGALMDDHDDLVEAVQTHLAPLLPEGVELYRIETSHNPIRVTDETRHLLEGNCDIQVEIEYYSIYEPDEWWNR